MTTPSLLTQNPVPRILLLLLAPLAALEALFTLSDMVGFPTLRDIFVGWFALWPSLWYGATPGFPGQSYTMLLTHSLVHGSAMHFIFNALWILLFGRALLSQLTLTHFLSLLATSILFGALFYIWLSATPNPAVGISGGVYGLGTFWAAGYLYDRFKDTGSLQPVFGGLGFIAVITLVVPFLMPSNIAWEAHLGGAITGLLWGAGYLYFHHTTKKTTRF